MDFVSDFKAALEKRKKKCVISYEINNTTAHSLETIEFLVGKDIPTSIKEMYTRLNSASGEKLQNIVDGKTIAYCGDFVYEDGALQYILNSEGRYLVSGDSGAYEYNLTDHLGNVRAVVDAAGVIKQKSNYYPFGGVFAKSGSPDNKYLYNGKELQEGTELYDFGNRSQDRYLGRWTTLDPMTESRYWVSGYNNCQNNPISRIDPDGMLDDDYFNENGKYLGSDGAETDNVKVTSQEVWDINKTVDESGNETIDHVIGNAISEMHSKSDISINSSLKIYDHYNPTDLDIVAHNNESGNGGLSFSYNRSRARIKVKIEGNKSTEIANHASEIYNSFIHEKQHNEDYKALGYTGYKNMSKSQKEQRAVTRQINHPSFTKKSTRKIEFRSEVIKYGKKHGLMLHRNSIVNTVQL